MSTIVSPPLERRLKKSGAEEDTLSVILCDNGVNRPLRDNKGQHLEGGIRVPFFVVWPGNLPARRIYEHPVITFDLLPTDFAVAGIAALKDLDGVDLMLHLFGRNKVPPHEAPLALQSAEGGSQAELVAARLALARLDGRSLTPQRQRQQNEVRDTFFLVHRDVQRAVRKVVPPARRPR